MQRPPPREHGAGIGERGGIGHGRARADGGRIVARHVGDGEREHARGRGLAQAPALDARDVPAHRVHLVDVGAAFEQPARQRRLGVERRCRARAPPTARRRRRRTGRAPDRWPSRRRPAPACARPPRRCRRQASDGARARRPMACAPSPRGSLRAVRGGREAGDAVEHAELAVVMFGGRGHGGRRLAGADHDDAAVGRAARAGAAAGRRRDGRRRRPPRRGTAAGRASPMPVYRLPWLRNRPFASAEQREHVQVRAAAVKRLAQAGDPPPRRRRGWPRRGALTIFGAHG